MNRPSIIWPSTLLVLLVLNANVFAAQILWTQYCQHQGKLKLLVHLDTDPTAQTPAGSQPVKLWLREKSDAEWQLADTQPVDPLTATALFVRPDWPRKSRVLFQVTCGESTSAGVFRAEPNQQSVLKVAGLSCHKDIGWPWKEAIAEVISHDPDLVIFTGDQIYENDYGSPMFRPQTKAEVPAGMKNYLTKWRKFGEAFRELMRDRPTIMITDDHDVFANDLWGNGGVRMQGSRTTGGYPTHPDWVNAAEFTQTGNLPDAIHPGPHGDGVAAYYTALQYGGVRFAILEDRKFKSPPSEVIKKAIGRKPSKGDSGIEVVKDPDFDCRTLDRADLQLLGKQQEVFLKQWSNDLKKSGDLGAVVSSSPWAHIAMYSPTSADLDSNAWPQSGRNRALQAIGDAPVVMFHGDVHLGTLGRHGVETFNDGPITYSFPSFSSRASRHWQPIKAGQNRAPGAPRNTGEFHDRFGNKITVYGAGNDLNGYGIILFDPAKREVELQFHPMNEERKPIKVKVPGWPHTVKF
ncbi:MAG TPA: hypothetical protein DCY79_24655 [Planctomycetaceae bacterium]|nr:hypothetical protein [Blastopirellula sp.]HAY83012.1 hypothetical protein [Planctomycetaceae bacterium]